MSERRNTWVCISCGKDLGTLIGQELHPLEGVTLWTQGANLVVTCPKCGSRKIWYPADPLLRVLKQFIDVIASETAKSAVRAVGAERRREAKRAIGENNG